MRDAGLPADYPNDVVYRTTFLGREITRIKIPCRAERYTAKDGPDTWWPTPEPPHRINQIYLEPVLFAHLSAMPSARIFNGTSLVDFTQGAEGVTAFATADGRKIEISCKFLIGCDGGRSLVRKKIGATLSGDVALQHVQSSYIRAPKLLGMLLEQGGTPAWGSFSLNARQSGNVYAIDGRQNWLVHVYLSRGSRTLRRSTATPRSAPCSASTTDFEYELLSKEDWIGRRLIADKVRDDKRFHLRRCLSSLGTLCRLRHECRHCRRRQSGLASWRRGSKAGAKKEFWQPMQPSGCRSPIRFRISRWTMRMQWPTRENP